MRRNERHRPRRRDIGRAAAASPASYTFGLSFIDEDESTWAMRDYFWMVQERLLEHEPGGWASFREGYAAMGRVDLECETHPPAPNRHAA